MSYVTGRDALKTVLSSAPLTDAFTVRINDWRDLNSGRGAVYLIIRRGGPAEPVYMAGGQRETRWQAVVEVWRRFGLYPDTANALDEDMDTVRDHIDKNRKLGGVVTDVFTRQIAEPQEIAMPGESSPSWLRQNLIVEWIYEDSVTLAE